MGGTAAARAVWGCLEVMPAELCPSYLECCYEGEGEVSDTLPASYQSAVPKKVNLLSKQAMLRLWMPV